MASDDYSDDPTIPSDAELWRRIPPWHFVHDGNTGQIRPSSAAFEDHPNGSPMSVILAQEAGDPQHALAGHQGFALASITAALAREHGLGMARDPRPDDPPMRWSSERKTRESADDGRWEPAGLSRHHPRNRAKASACLRAHVGPIENHRCGSQ